MFKKIQKRFRVVAYNNVCYKEHKFVTEPISYFSCRNWIIKNARYDMYIYDIYDIKLNKFEMDYSGLFNDYEKIKNVINNTNNNYIHKEQILNMVFLFKEYWSNKKSFNVTKKYFEELHILVNNKYPLNY
jgi:hypothetical protein